MSSTVPFVHGARKLFKSAAVRRWDLDNDQTIIDRIKAIAGAGSVEDFGYYPGTALNPEISTIPRQMQLVSNLGTLAGTARFTFFPAPRAGTFTKLRSLSGTTAGVGTTLARMAIYSVAANGDLTRLAMTPSDATLWSAASTAYERATDVSYSVTRGQRLAFATLVVGSTTAPTMGGSGASNNVEALRPPRVGGAISGQTDLAASYTDSQFSATTFGGYYYGVLVP